MNPFKKLPAKARTAIYTAYGLVALADTSAAAYFGAIGHDVPAWVIGIGGALVPIGAAVGATAVSNVQGA